MSDEIRKLVTRALVSAGVLSGAAAIQPPKDARPRFKNGRLRDEWERLTEELDLDLVHDPLLGPAYSREHKAELDRWVELKADRERDERAAAQTFTVGNAKNEADLVRSQRDNLRLALEQERAALDEKLAVLDAEDNPPAE